METITYNREDYSGETSTVVINDNGTFEDSLYGKGTWKLSRIGEDVLGPDEAWDELEVTISGMRFKAFSDMNFGWFSRDGELNRQDDNGIVACLKVASNLM